MAAPDRPTRIVLVRHGEANCNVDQFVGGHNGCTGLTDRGIRQVESLRDRWKGSGELGAVTALYSSTLARARETAAILAPAVGGLDPVADCEFCEFHVGDEADGLPWTEVQKRYPDVFERTADPFGRPAVGDGWESIEEFRLRVGRALFRLAREHEGQTVVVAAHGGVVDVSMVALLNLPTQRDARPADLLTHNASVTEWERQPVGRAERPGAWRLVRYNDVAHIVERT